MDFFPGSFLDEFLEDSPSSLTAHQDAGNDKNITDDRESPKDGTISSGFFVVMIYFLILFLLFLTLLPVIYQ